MPSIRCLQPLFARRRQYQPNDSPVEKLLSPVPAGPVEHHVTRKHPEQADRERKPPPDDTLVAQHSSRDDWHFFRDWHSETGKQKHGEHAEVSEGIDELLEDVHGATMLLCFTPSCVASQRHLPRKTLPERAGCNEDLNTCRQSRLCAAKHKGSSIPTGAARSVRYRTDQARSAPHPL